MSAPVVPDKLLRAVIAKYDALKWDLLKFMVTFPWIFSAFILTCF